MTGDKICRPKLDLSWRKINVAAVPIRQRSSQVGNNFGPSFLSNSLLSLYSFFLTYIYIYIYIWFPTHVFKVHIHCSATIFFVQTAGFWILNTQVQGIRERKRKPNFWGFIGSEFSYSSVRRGALIISLMGFWSRLVWIVRN